MLASAQSEIQGKRRIPLLSLDANKAREAFRAVGDAAVKRARNTRFAMTEKMKKMSFGSASDDELDHRNDRLRYLSEDKSIIGSSKKRYSSLSPSRPSMRCKGCEAEFNDLPKYFCRNCKYAFCSNCSSKKSISKSDARNKTDKNKLDICYGCYSNAGAISAVVTDEKNGKENLDLSSLETSSSKTPSYRSKGARPPPKPFSGMIIDEFVSLDLNSPEVKSHEPHEVRKIYKIPSVSALGDSLKETLTLNNLARSCSSVSSSFVVGHVEEDSSVRIGFIDNGESNHDGHLCQQMKRQSNEPDELFSPLYASEKEDILNAFQFVSTPPPRGIMADLSEEITMNIKKEAFSSFPEVTTITSKPSADFSRVLENGQEMRLNGSDETPDSASEDLELRNGDSEGTRVEYPTSVHAEISDCHLLSSNYNAVAEEKTQDVCHIIYNCVGEKCGQSVVAFDPADAVLGPLQQVASGCLDTPPVHSSPADSCANRTDDIALSGFKGIRLEFRPLTSTSTRDEKPVQVEPTTPYQIISELSAALHEVKIGALDEILCSPEAKQLAAVFDEELNSISPNRCASSTELIKRKDTLRSNIEEHEVSPLPVEKAGRNVLIAPDEPVRISPEREEMTENDDLYSPPWSENIVRTASNSVAATSDEVRSRNPFFVSPAGNSLEYSRASSASSQWDQSNYTGYSGGRELRSSPQSSLKIEFGVLLYDDILEDNEIEIGSNTEAPMVQVYESMGLVDNLCPSSTSFYLNVTLALLLALFVSAAVIFISAGYQSTLCSDQSDLCQVFGLSRTESEVLCNLEDPQSMCHPSQPLEESIDVNEVPYVAEFVVIRQKITSSAYSATRQAVLHKWAYALKPVLSVLPNVRDSLKVALDQDVYID